MWSDDLLLAHAATVVCARKETQLYREPILYLIDSYGCHIKLADSKRLERYDIFVLLVLPNLTNLLQPLDAAVNHSYQEYYRSKFDDYISLSLRNFSLQTKAGNPKVPQYTKVAQWTLDRIATKSAADIKKAFSLCGLVTVEDFKMDMLHPPLKALLKSDLDMNAWHTACQHLVNEGAEQELVLVSAPDWYIPHQERSSLFNCLPYGLDMSAHEYASNLTNYKDSSEDLEGLLDEQYLEAVRNDNTDPAELEIYAASKMHGWNITLNTVGEASRLTSSFTYTVENATNDVVLVRGGGYFAVQVDGYLV